MTDSEISARLRAAQQCRVRRSLQRCRHCADSGVMMVCPKSLLTPVSDNKSRKGTR